MVFRATAVPARTHQQSARTLQLIGQAVEGRCAVVRAPGRAQTHIDYTGFTHRLGIVEDDMFVLLYETNTMSASVATP